MKNEKYLNHVMDVTVVCDFLSHLICQELLGPNYLSASRLQHDNPTRHNHLLPTISQSFHGHVKCRIQPFISLIFQELLGPNHPATSHM